MAIYNLEIQLFHSFSVLYLFSVKISRLYINYIFKIDNIENVSSQGVPLIIENMSLESVKHLTS